MIAVFVQTMYHFYDPWIVLPWGIAALEAIVIIGLIWKD